MNGIDQAFILKYRWFILAIGVLAQVTFATAFAGIPVAGIVMRDSYHFSTNQLGFVLGCMGLGVALSEIVWGILTDKLGDKIVLVTGLLAMGATFVTIATGFVPEPGRSPDYLAIGGLLVLAGAVGGSINSSSGRAVMSWFQDGERGFAMSIRQTAIPVGGAIGSVVVPWIASSYGFRSAFLSLACLCALTAASVWKWIIEIDSNNTRSTIATEDASPLRRFSVWRIALAGALLTVPQMAVLSFAGLFMKDHQHIRMALISLVFVFIQLGGAAMRIFTGKYTDRNKNRREVIRFIAIVAGSASVALGMFAEGNGFVVMPLLILTGIAGHAWHGIAYTEIAVMSGVRRAGTALGMMGTTVFAATFATPFFLPYVLRAGSWKGVWIVVGTLTLVALTLVIKPVPLVAGAKGAKNG